MELWVEDKIRGVLFGQAIGDALGVGTEFLARSEIPITYPEGLEHYSQIGFISKLTHKFEQLLDDWRWQPGDWTDDTDQMLCILDSIIALHQLDIYDIATRFQEWAKRDGFGIGRTVYLVVNDPEFLQNPHKVAHQYWEYSKYRSAANGAVMRTSVLGIWQYKDANQVRKNAEDVCKITHADPRCIASCIAVCVAISQILQGREDIENLIDEIAQELDSVHPDMKTYFDQASKNSLRELKLDEGFNPRESVKWSYTLKTLAAGFWALRYASSFREGILAIINEGGDSDTNGAVAGALLGAKFGYQGIETIHWIDELIHYQSLEKRVQDLIALL